MRRRKAIRSQFVTEAKRKNARANIECYAKVKIGDGKIETNFIISVFVSLRANVIYGHANVLVAWLAVVILGMFENVVTDSSLPHRVASEFSK